LTRYITPTRSQSEVMRFYDAKRMTEFSAMGGSVAEWLACWTQAQKGLGSTRSRADVG